MLQHSIVRTVLITCVALSCRGSGAPEGAGSTGGVPSRDSLLLAAARVALPPESLTATDLPGAGSPGASMVVNYCMQCHGLPSPKAHSATDWPGVARRMWLRAEWLPAEYGVKVPTMGERYVMLDYLTTHAMAATDSGALPPGRGRETFAVMCSRCHALPDPRVHSPDDWPIVYSRMERNMDRMGIPRPAGSEPGEILEYLRLVSAPK
jgi:cytochrome c5